jgi:hypothetical protein
MSEKYVFHPGELVDINEEDRNFLMLDANPDYRKDNSLAIIIERIICNEYDEDPHETTLYRIFWVNSAVYDSLCAHRFKRLE